MEFKKSNTTEEYIKEFIDRLFKELYIRTTLNKEKVENILNNLTSEQFESFMKGVLQDVDMISYEKLPISKGIERLYNTIILLDENYKSHGFDRNN